jgi:hypothetical protein
VVTVTIFVGILDEVRAEVIVVFTGEGGTDETGTWKEGADVVFAGGIDVVFVGDRGADETGVEEEEVDVVFAGGVDVVFVGDRGTLFLQEIERQM